MRYEYKNICKNVFINKYEQLNIVEDYKVLFDMIKKQESYIVKFDENNLIKLKIYLLNCVVGNNN